MQDQTKQIPSDRDRQVERAIVLQALRDDRGEDWSRADLAAELDHPDPIAIDDALTRLEDEEVIEFEGETIRASRAAMHLNDLGMVAI
jgi:hypothetical protein